MNELKLARSKINRYEELMKININENTHTHNIFFHFISPSTRFFRFDSFSSNQTSRSGVENLF
jgi:hypothetical protein